MTVIPSHRDLDTFASPLTTSMKLANSSIPKASSGERLTEGRMKNVAFVLDPDGYWIEVIQNERIKRTSNW